MALRRAHSSACVLPVVVVRGRREGRKWGEWSCTVQLPAEAGGEDRALWADHYTAHTVGRGYGWRFRRFRACQPQEGGVLRCGGVHSDLRFYRPEYSGVLYNCSGTPEYFGICSGNTVLYK